MASRLLPHMERVRELCEAGKTDAYIAHVLSVGVTERTVKTFRRRYNIFGPHSNRRRYPYKEWFDGEEHTITEGVHFHIRPQYMQTVISAAARRRDGILTIMRVGETITFRFTKNER